MITPPLELLWDGPDDAPLTVMLAHGAGAGMEHPFVEAIAHGLAAHDLRVVRFEYPYQREARAGHRRAPDRMPVLHETMREVLALCPKGPIVLAGKSMGGRASTMLADTIAARACIVFGYPFHPPKEPTKLRTEHLASLQTRTLILQGERDPFGTREQVEGYVLSPAITVQWLADGDHSLAPRQRSGFTAEQHLATAIAAAAAFAKA
ncbi:MAG: alpha/beta hydrolase [Planctomycetes bacterium]|jgi:predicted alpha/beta-hydrolase family hydrolase|nr:alpha/beta hydrolase [Planctomycetota bacterium]MCC7064600.1 alpha/beta hydrolase [Planctomycetota bacterium]